MFRRRPDAPDPMELEDVPGGPDTGTLIVDLADLPDHGGAEIVFGEEDDDSASSGTGIRVLVQRLGDAIHVYENRCPHAGTPLNLFGPDFLDISGQKLICRTHGALFDPKDGYCTRGPCKGEHLRAIAHTIRDGKVYSA